MLAFPTADGAGVRATDEGRGRVIVILHPGLDDGSSWKRVATLLAENYRVLRVHRRQYRLDVPPPITMGDEAADVLALARGIGKPVVLIGHSSGAVAALEALAAAGDDEAQLFAGAILYEPPLVIDEPLGGEANDRARVAIEEGKPGRAMQIFTRDIVRLPAWQAVWAAAFVTVVPKFRRLMPRQVDDCAAIDALGSRLDAYSRIQTPVLLLGGDSSPAHLSDRLDALQRALPRVERTLLEKQGHSAHYSDPQLVSGLVDRFASKILH